MVKISNPYTLNLKSAYIIRQDSVHIKCKIFHIKSDISHMNPYRQENTGSSCSYRQ